MHKIKGYRDEWRIQEYLLITFFISWLSWGILITLTALGIVSFHSALGTILFVIGGFGPTISAILCLEGKLSFAKVWHFIIDHKPKTLGYLLLFAALITATISLSSLETNPTIPWYSLPILLLVVSLVGGGNEELGWRGTFQPVLERVLGQKIKNPFLNFVVSALIVGAVWALWHLPLWFVNGSGQQAINFGLFALSALGLAIWLACLYRCTGSVFYCMLLHGLANLLLSFFVIKINWILVLGFVVITALAIFLGGRARPVRKSEEE